MVGDDPEGADDIVSDLVVGEALVLKVVRNLIKSILSTEFFG
jgi:hypothetical protein